MTTRAAFLSVMLCAAMLPIGADASPGQTARGAAPRAAAQAGMTNDDVVQMVKAGLADDIVITSIKQAAAHAFDVTPSGLVALKKAGVSDAVISAVMSQQSAAPAAPKSVPAAPAAPSAPASAGHATAAVVPGRVPAMVLEDDGLFYIDGASVVRFEAKTPYQTRTGSTLASKLTLGLKPARLNAMLPGLSADAQVGVNPSFYLHLAEGESVGEYYLIRFTMKPEQSRRELEVGSASFYKVQSGFAEKDLFLIDAKRLQKDIYLVTPKAPLPPGEFGLLQVPPPTATGQTGLTPRKIFDFAVR